jgi:hypothetical protein
MKRSVAQICLGRKPIRKRRAKPRRGRVTDPKYLAWIRTLPCVVCNVLADNSDFSWRIWSRLVYNRLQRSPTEAAHSGPHGLGQKADDRQALPLCMMCHREGPNSYHRLSRRFFAFHGLDRDMIVQELNSRYDAISLDTQASFDAI